MFLPRNDDGVVKVPFFILRNIAAGGWGLDTLMVLPQLRSCLWSPLTTTHSPAEEMSDFSLTFHVAIIANIRHLSQFMPEIGKMTVTASLYRGCFRLLSIFLMFLDDMMKLMKHHQLRISNFFVINKYVSKHTNRAIHRMGLTVWTARQNDTRREEGVGGGRLLSRDNFLPDIGSYSGTLPSHSQDLSFFSSAPYCLWRQ